MENASKALLMAAGVLIGMLVLSLMVYLFVSFGTTSKEIRQEQVEKQLNQFNTQFTSYVGKNKNIYDVVTLANLATKNNQYYELPFRNYASNNGNDNYISVFLDDATFDSQLKGNIEGSSNSSSKDYDAIIKEGLKVIETGTNKELAKYECTVDISPTTQRVYRVKFKKQT